MFCLTFFTLERQPGPPFQTPHGPPPRENQWFAMVWTALSLGSQLLTGVGKSDPLGGLTGKLPQPVF